jgi:hypothetical protein
VNRQISFCIKVVSVSLVFEVIYWHKAWTFSLKYGRFEDLVFLIVPTVIVPILISFSVMLVSKSCLFIQKREWFSVLITVFLSLALLHVLWAWLTHIFTMR